MGASSHASSEIIMRLRYSFSLTSKEHLLNFTTSAREFNSSPSILGILPTHPARFYLCRSRLIFSSISKESLLCSEQTDRHQARFYLCSSSLSFPAHPRKFNSVPNTSSYYIHSHENITWFLTIFTISILGCELLFLLCFKHIVSSEAWAVGKHIYFFPYTHTANIFFSHIQF